MNGQRQKVLIVDDDKDLLELLKYNFSKEGYTVKVVADSKRAVKAARVFAPDLIVLDIMMPQPNGIEVCRELRSKKEFEQTYIFFLTAKSESYYKQAAYETGADDYIEKIMGLGSLTKKISAVLQRNYIIRKRSGQLNLGNFSLDRSSGSVTINGQIVNLSKPEFELLFFFAQNPGRSVKRQNLLQVLGGALAYMSEFTVDYYIEEINRKLQTKSIRQQENGSYYFQR